MWHQICDVEKNFYRKLTTILIFLPHSVTISQCSSYLLPLLHTCFLTATQALQRTWVRAKVRVLRDTEKNTSHAITQRINTQILKCKNTHTSRHKRKSTQKSILTVFSLEVWDELLVIVGNLGLKEKRRGKIKH